MTVTTPLSSAAAPVRERRHDVDLLRVVCTAAVVLCHTAAVFVDAGHRTTGHAADALTRFAVPAFFAMAGWAALAASPVRGEGQLLRRADRIVRPMALWTLFYVAWRGTPEDAAAALFGSVEAAFHLWYLYVYVPLLLVLGAVVLLVRERGRTVPWWTLGLLAVCAFGGAARADLGESAGLDLPSWEWGLSLYPLGYALLGAGLLGAARSLGPRWPWAVAAVGCLAALTAYQLGFRFPAAYASLPVAALTFAVLGAFRGVRVPRRWRGPVERLSDASFGAYLVHLAPVTALSALLADRVPHGGPALLAMAAVAVASTAVSFALAHLWGRLGLRAWLG